MHNKNLRLGNTHTQIYVNVSKISDSNQISGPSILTFISPKTKQIENHICRKIQLSYFFSPLVISLRHIHFFYWTHFTPAKWTEVEGQHWKASDSCIAAVSINQFWAFGENLEVYNKNYSSYPLNLQCPAWEFLPRMAWDQHLRATGVSSREKWMWGRQIVIWRSSWANSMHRNSTCSKAFSKK